MKIKNIITGLLVLIFLASCAPAVTVVTETTIPTSTITPIAPTPLPPTITPTLDPMKNAPDGATGIDKDGKYYMEAENGEKYYYDETRGQFYWKNKVDGYIYFYFEALAKQEAYLARPWIENYYAYDFEDNSGWNYEGFNAIPIDVWVKYDTPGSESIVKMTHRDVVSSDDISQTHNHMNSFLIDKFQISDFPSLYAALTSDTGIPYEFIFNGETMSSTLGTNGGFRITFVSEDELKPLALEKKAVRSNGNLGYIYVTYDGVENGKVLVRVASSQPLDKLLGNSPAGDPQYELRYMIFLPLMNILVADEGTDLINIAAMTSAGIVASRSAFLRNKDHKPDLQIEYK